MKLILLKKKHTSETKVVALFIPWPSFFEAPNLGKVLLLAADFDILVF